MELYSCGSSEVPDSIDTRARDPYWPVVHASLDFRRSNHDDEAILVEVVSPGELLTCVCDAPHPLVQIDTEEYPRCFECWRLVRGFRLMAPTVLRMQRLPCLHGARLMAAAGGAAGGNCGDPFRAALAGGEPGAEGPSAEGTPVARSQASPEEKAVLKALPKQTAEQKADFQRRQKTEKLLQQVRDLGRWPKESAGRSLAERHLARKIRDARKTQQFSPEQEAELQRRQRQKTEGVRRAQPCRAAAGQDNPDSPAERLLARKI